MLCISVKYKKKKICAHALYFDKYEYIYQIDNAGNLVLLPSIVLSPTTLIFDLIKIKNQVYAFHLILLQEIEMLF